MSVNVTFAGKTYTVAQQGDPPGWGNNESTYLQAIANYAFTKQGDFSNGTLSLRQYIQTYTSNAPTSIPVVPNGTATQAELALYNQSAFTNASSLSLGVNSTQAYIATGITGSGSLLPIVFASGSTEQLRILTTGAISIGTTGTNYGTSGQVLTSQGNAAPIWTTPSTSFVTSVGLSDGSTSSIYSISGSPVTSNGTLSFTLKTQTANLIFAGPASGGAVQPSFRSLVIADLPASIPNTNLANSSLTVTAGTGLSGGGLVSLGGSVTLSNAGVTSLAGTANEVAVSGSTGSITLSLPQNIVIPTPSSGVGLTVSGPASGTAVNVSSGAVQVNGSAGLVGQVLTSQGASATPVWKAPMLIQSTAPNAAVAASLTQYLTSPSIAANSLNTGNIYKLTCSFHIPTADGSNNLIVQMHFGTTGTSSDSSVNGLNISQATAGIVVTEQYFIITATGSAAATVSSSTLNLPTSSATSWTGASVNINTTVANYLTVYMQNNSGTSGTVLFAATLQQVV